MPPLVDRGLPLLTRAADRSRLWMVLSAGLVATGDPRARRAAARGLGSIAVASLLANQVGKRALARRRPGLDSLPIRRIAHRIPTSSSFPSGHSASAAAFAVGAAIEFPELAVPLGALAGAVAFSRVFTGVHFPSDVLAGTAIGAATAAAGAVVVPAHHQEPIRQGGEPARSQPPRPRGEGVVAVVNPSSGGGAGRAVLDQLPELLPAAELVELRDDDDLAEVFASAAARADVLGVAGGDGTVNAAAQAAMAADIPLLVLPAGTFNHFAKDLDLTELSDATEAVQAGRAVCIDVGEANGQPFLNTASLGSYPEFVKVRERWERRLGKPLAAALAMMTVARRCPPLDAEVDGAPRRLVLLFIGNGPYEPRGFVPRWRPRLDTGQLEVRLADATRGGTIWRLAVAAMTGSLYRTSRYVESRQSTCEVRVKGEPGYLARDGEAAAAPAAVTFSVRTQALTVFRGVPNHR